MDGVTANPSRPKHFLANVQALRAIAALLVVFVHASLPDVGVESILRAGDAPWLSPFHYIGLCGVDLFFVISGFIMLVTNWENFGKPLAGARFFARRIIRIYPPYWLAVLPVLPILLFAKDRFMGNHVGVKTGFIDSLLLLPNPNKFILTVGWTLVWEMVFYVVFALLLQLNRRYAVWALAGWMAVQIALYLTLTGAPNFYLNFASSPLPMEFIAGTGIGLLYVKRLFPAPRTAAAIAAAAAVATWAVIAHFHILLESANDINRVLAFGIPAALLVYGGVGLEVCGVFVAPRALQAVGDGSYAIYLWHLSILVALRQIIERLHLGGPIAHAAVLTVTFAIIIAFGMAVYRFFEKPVTDYLNAKLAQGFPLRSLDATVVARPLSQSVSD